MQGLRERSKQRRRDEVLLAARALVIEGGAEALTMRALADRAEVSVPTVYSLIGGRDAVITAMLERGGEQFAAALATCDPDPLTRIHQAIDVFCAGLAANQPVVRALVHAPVAWTDAPGAARYRLRDAIAEALTAAQRTGVIDRSASAATLADHLDALTLGAVAQWARRPGHPGHPAAADTDAADLAARLHHAAAMLLAAHARPAWRDRLHAACARTARTIPTASPAVPTTAITSS